MSDQATKPNAERACGSIKEAIGKITGDRDAIREGAAEKSSVESQSPETA